MATYQREQLLLDLRDNVIELTVNQNGANQTIRVTHAEAMLPINVTHRFITEQHQHMLNAASIVAWAVDAKKWFVFKIKDVRYAQVIDGYL